MSRILLILILWCHAVMAQFAVEQPFFLASTSAPGGDIIVQQGGLALRWVASDLTNNWIVTNWFDRVQGVIFTNGNISRRPTNSTLGVWLDDTHYLTNLPISLPPNSTNSTVVSIVDFQVGKSTSPDNLYLWSDNAGGGSRFGYGVDVSSLYFGIPSISPWTANNFPYRKLDIIMWQKTNSPSANTFACYTNGIQSVTNFTGWRGPGNLAQLGRNAVSGGFFGGYYMELIVYTNLSYSSSMISNIHWYATNTYGISP